MLFHGTRLLADDSHEILYLIFFRKLGKMLQNLLSAAIVIGALRVKNQQSGHLSSAPLVLLQKHGPRSDCSLRSSLIRVHSIASMIKISSEVNMDIYE